MKYKVHIRRQETMSDINKRISAIGCVPVIKLDNPEQDIVPLAKALCAGGDGSGRIQR